MPLSATATHRLKRLRYHARMANRTANGLREEVEQWNTQSQKARLDFEIASRNYRPVVLDGPLAYYFEQNGRKSEIAKDLSTFARAIYLSGERLCEAQANFNAHQQRHSGLSEMEQNCSQFARECKETSNEARHRAEALLAERDPPARKLPISRPPPAPMPRRSRTLGLVVAAAASNIAGGLGSVAQAPGGWQGSACTTAPALLFARCRLPDPGGRRKLQPLVRGPARRRSEISQSRIEALL